MLRALGLDRSSATFKRYDWAQGSILRSSFLFCQVGIYLGLL